MPEISFSFSYSSLWAVAATSILAAVTAHQLLVRFPEPSRKQKRRSRSKRSKLQPIPEDELSDEDDSSSDSNTSTTKASGSVPPPPKPLAGLTSSKRPRRSLHAAATKILNMYSTAGNDDALSVGAEWGFSMEDARARAEEMASAKSLRSPREILEDLQKGNARFWTGVATRPELSAFERRALIKQQFPSVAVLGCSDSRVPVEIVFDQGLGDMFVIRVAGNHLDNASHASLQYAIMALKVKVVVILGHEGCGAVKHAMDPQDVIDKQPKELSHMLSQIKGNLDEEMLFNLPDMKARDRVAVVTNVKSQVEELTRDRAVTKLVNDHQLLIVGAFYEISSGIVDFFHEVSNLPPFDEPETAGEETEHNSPKLIERLPSRGVQTRYDLKTHEVITPRKLSRNATN